MVDDNDDVWVADQPERELAPHATLEPSSQSRKVLLPDAAKDECDAGLDDSWARVDALIQRGLERSAREEQPVENDPLPPAPAAPSAPAAEKPKGRQTASSGAGFRGAARFDLISTAPKGSGFHIRGRKGLRPVNGDVEAFVQHNGWYLNGLHIMLGTTASGADEQDIWDPALGVQGVLPRAVAHLHRLATASHTIDSEGDDNGGRPYQFGVAIVLGREDHCRLFESLRSPSAELKQALAHAGARTETFQAVATNHFADVIALTIRFKDRRAGGGTHLIYLHPTMVAGGGKSDLSLRDGNLRLQTSHLSEEFRWWVAGLELGPGKISGIESGLGGTARLARYALLMRTIPHHLIAHDAVEHMGIDDAAWVRDHLGSEHTSYRTNFATTLLRGAWGRFASRLSGMPIHLTRRNDHVVREVRAMHAIIATLRSLFPANESLRPMKGDISDERYSVYREEVLTESQYTTIEDPVRRAGPWEQSRRIRVMGASRIAVSTIIGIGLGQEIDGVEDRARDLIEGLRGLATAREDAVAPGRFAILHAIVPERSDLSNTVLNDACEQLVNGLRANGVEHVVVHQTLLPIELFGEASDFVLFVLQEDQPGTTLLIASTDEIDIQQRRVIMRNPEGRNTDGKWKKGAKAYSRFLRAMYDSHLDSGLDACVRDGELIRAFHSYWFGPNHGNIRPYALGGPLDRPRRGKRLDDAVDGGRNHRSGGV